MPRRLYPCTPSRLNTWRGCPRRYRMTYLDRPTPPKGPPWAHTSVGASAHNALAAWWRLPRGSRTVQAAGHLLRRGWLTDGFGDAGRSATWRERTAEMVERYVSTLDPGFEPVGVERTVATRTDRIAVSGRIDRLDRRDASLVVVDYKTGRRLLTADDARGSLALAIYAFAAARVMHRPCYRVELHHLPSGDVASWEHTDDSLRDHLTDAEDLASECADADDAYRSGVTDDRRFPPRPGRGCSWCDFRRHCPEGRAASESRVSWSALPS